MGELIVPIEAQEEAFRPRELLPGFFAINGNSPTEANGFALLTSDVVLGFDLGSNTYQQRTASHLGQISSGRPVIMLATHLHLDHAGGAMSSKDNHTIKELWGPEPEPDVSLGSQTASYLYDHYPEEIRVDRYLRDQEVLHFGSTTINVIKTPGHTKSHLSFLVTPFNQPSFAILGDLLGGISSDLGSNREEQVRSAYRVDNLPFSYFVEGHGGIQKIEDHDFYSHMIEGIGEQLRPGFKSLQDQLRR